MHHLPYQTLLREAAGVVSLILSAVVAINYRHLSKWGIERAERNLKRKGLAWQLPFARVGGLIWLIGVIIGLALLGIQLLFFPD